jgi:RNase P subunit RPR2
MKVRSKSMEQIQLLFLKITKIMGERLICKKCHGGLYSYSEPDRDDWENREMSCEVCGHTHTLKKMTDEFFESIGQGHLAKLYNN